MVSRCLKLSLNKRSEENKTDIWEIISIQSSESLGEIRWCDHWRKYVFVPMMGTIFDINYMEDIIWFMQFETLKRKKQSTIKEIICL
jgi:hypothetical protein